MSNSKIQMIAKVAIMGALASIIMIIDIPLPFVPPFYKLDFSEVIILLSGFALGPIPAIGVEAIKILIHLLLEGSQTAGVGEVANFIMGCSYVIPAVIIYRQHKTKKQAVIGLFIGMVSLTIIASLLNYFILLPVYASAFQMPMDALIAMGTAVNPSINSLVSFILIAVVPFNIVKGGLVGLFVFLLYKHVSPVIKKNYNHK